MYTVASPDPDPNPRGGGQLPDADHDPNPRGGGQYLTLTSAILHQRVELGKRR